MQRTFRITQEPYVQRVQRATVWFMAIMLLGVAGFFSFLGAHFDLALAATAVSVLFAFWIAVRRARQRTRDTAASFEIILEENQITRRVGNLPDMTLLRDSIQNIYQTPGGDLVVRASGRQQVIAVPRELDDVLSLREALVEWRPIEPRTVTGSVIAVIATMAATVAVVGAALISSNPRIVVPAAALVAIAMPVCGVLILRSPHYDRRMRRGAYICFLFPLVMIVRIYVALTHSLMP